MVQQLSVVYLQLCFMSMLQVCCSAPKAEVLTSAPRKSVCFAYKTSYVKVSGCCSAPKKVVDKCPLSSWKRWRMSNGCHWWFAVLMFKGLVIFGHLWLNFSKFWFANFFEFIESCRNSEVFTHWILFQRLETTSHSFTGSPERKHRNGS